LSASTYWYSSIILRKFAEKAKKKTIFLYNRTNRKWDENGGE
jgi:hypothetical protein